MSEIPLKNSRSGRGGRAPQKVSSRWADVHPGSGSQLLTAECSPVKNNPFAEM